jgi:transcription initiation factor TFIIIB Brf1 subunit/transcription initiation factor TFIIB
MGWYFSREELKKLPSIGPTMSEAQVRSLTQKALEFLTMVGMKLRLPQLTIATAVVMFQRFFVVNSLKKYDLFKLAATALFLAGKVEETPKKLRDVALMAWESDPRRKKEETDLGFSDTSQE